jgi:DNA-binding MarR family transcriptional regulator/GNAT superfamily N-acetyltransferase
MNYFDQVGKIALGTRVRFLGEKITQDAAEIYKLYGINMVPKWFPVFFVLSQGRVMTISEIASEIGHSHVSVSKIVAEMLKAKLVTEKHDSRDGRRTLVALSPSGKMASRKIKAQYTDVGRTIDELISEARHNLWEALGEWENLLEKKSLLSRVTANKNRRELPEVKIEAYRPKYRNAFRELNEAWITKHFKMEKPDHDALDHPKEYILERGGFIFVATIAGKAVGVCALITRNDPTYPYELAKMAVSTDFRGMNIGFLLGQAVIEKARELKVKRLFLESNTVLKPAIGLYQKLGFKEIKGPATPYRRCNIQMELKIASSGH